MTYGVKSAIAVHALAIVVTCAAATSGESPLAAGVGTEAEAVSFMTLNVQVFLAPQPGVVSNLESLAALIERVGVDIVALQESDANTILGAHQNGPWWLARRLGYHHYYGAPSSAHTTGVALLSRWPIRDAGWTLLPASASIPRAALVAAVDAPVRSIRVVVGHLQWAEAYLPNEPSVAYSADQAAQTRALAQLAATDEPVVVMGDFNAGPGYPGPAYDIFRDSFEDAWVEAGNAPEDPAGWTWSASEPTMRIDFIWFSPDDWSVVPGSGLTLGDESVSDHKAVYVEAFLNP